MSETRSAIMYCPFCGEEDLHPHADGGWECRSCLRVFRVTVLGLARRPSSEAKHAAAQHQEGGGLTVVPPFAMHTHTHHPTIRE